MPGPDHRRPNDTIFSPCPRSLDRPPRPNPFCSHRPMPVAQEERPSECNGMENVARGTGVEGRCRKAGRSLREHGHRRYPGCSLSRLCDARRASTCARAPLCRSDSTAHLHGCARRPGDPSSITGVPSQTPATARKHLQLPSRLSRRHRRFPRRPLTCRFVFAHYANIRPISEWSQ